MGGRTDTVKDTEVLEWAWHKVCEVVLKDRYISRSERLTQRNTVAQLQTVADSLQP